MSHPFPFPPRRPWGRALRTLALLALPLATAAQPTLSGFTPTSGPVGTSVTLMGTGFSATAGQNVVFFGATQAPVTAASATSLTVTVPLGTTYEYPSVTNLTSVLTACAARPFGVTLNGAVAFDPKADVGTGAFPYSVSRVSALNPRTCPIGRKQSIGGVALKFQRQQSALRRWKRAKNLWCGCLVRCASATWAATASPTFALIS